MHYFSLNLMLCFVYLAQRSDVGAGNDITDELAAFQYTFWKPRWMSSLFAIPVNKNIKIGVLHSPQILDSTVCSTVFMET